MFGWFKKKKDIYSPEERQIFKFFNGSRIVYADPIPLWKRVADVGPILSIDIKVANSMSKDAGTAKELAASKVRKIFNLKELENGIEIPTEGTLTDDECFGVLNEFLEWSNRLKKNSKTTVISAEETLPSLDSSSVDSPPTKNTQASGSTVTDPKPGTPTKSPKVSASGTGTLIQD